MTAIKRLSCGVAGLALLLSTQTASAQYKKNVYLEAECPTSFQGAYGTKRTTTASYSGQGYIKSQGNTTATTYNNTSADHAFYTFTTDTLGFYLPHFRVNTNGNAANDSFFYRIDGDSWETANSLSSLGGGWRWYQGTYLLGAGPGPHTLEIANRETGLEIDKIALVDPGDPAPTGQGGQAYNCPVSVYFEAECPTTALGAYPFKRFIKTGYTGGGYLYSAGNTTSATSSTDVAIYPFDSGTSTYRFYFRIDTNNNANDDSWFYRVDSGAWTTMNNITSASGWRWVQGTATASLSVGRHTLEVRNREDGLNLDRIAFIPSSGSAPSGTGPAGVNCDPASTMSSWNYYQQGEYANTHVNYFGSSVPMDDHMMIKGDMILVDHDDWHRNNDSGGTAGPGSGISFLGMHRSMVNDFRKFALANGQRSWIPLSLNNVLPEYVSDAYNSLAAAGGTWVDQYSPRGGSDLTGVFIPAYLTVEGASGGAPVGTRWGGATFQFEVNEVKTGPIYSKLNDIPNLDTLGRIIGESGFHGTIHGLIGGTMGSFYSPSDPFFYAWHGLIDTIVDTWLSKTTAGRNWMNANPNHPFLKAGFTSMTGWNNCNWQGTMVCP